MVGFLGWSLLLVRAATSDQIGVRVDRLGGWGGLLLGFCGWWLEFFFHLTLLLEEFC